MTDTILVVGGTGNQGNAVIDQLLASDEAYEILALTRDASHAQATAEKGEAVELVEGDLDDKDSFRAHADRADKVFACINFWTLGYDRQVRYGRNLAEVLGEISGIDHVVYSGVANQDLDTGVPHFDSAQEITEALRAEELPLTTLKPVYFSENWEVMLEDIADGTLAFPLAEGQHHQHTTYKDTARAARIAFENPDKFIGVEENIASHVLTLSDVTEQINEISGFDAAPYHVPVDDAYEEFGEEFGRMAEWWQNTDGETSFVCTPDETEETFGFATQTFEEYLQENNWDGGKEAPSHIPGWTKAMQE